MSQTFEPLTTFAKTDTYGLFAPGNGEWVRKAISGLDRGSQTTGGEADSAEILSLLVGK